MTINRDDMIVKVTDTKTNKVVATVSTSQFKTVVQSITDISLSASLVCFINTYNELKRDEGLKAVWTVYKGYDYPI